VNEQAPLHTPVTTDRFSILTQKKKIPIPVSLPGKKTSIYITIIIISGYGGSISLYVIIIIINLLLFTILLLFSPRAANE